MSVYESCHSVTQRPARHSQHTQARLYAGEWILDVLYDSGEKRHVHGAARRAVPQCEWFIFTAVRVDMCASLVLNFERYQVNMNIHIDVESLVLADDIAPLATVVRFFVLGIH